ncbi:MAG: hypothetical protein ASARMPRED_005442 [Alectoria sarmentosa]|nr:MAG: hypothetical protein ASARMPRED_005442 [Alectoria sarmentosa]
MASPTIVPSSTPIAQLNPDLRPDESSVTGIVTLIWPYASSKETFSLLLVEPDFRLRSKRGQVRVHFQGSSAKAVARSGISSGDQLLLSLRGAQWEKSSTAAVTPGRGIDLELHFGERLVLQIQRPSQQPIPLDIDHPAPSPEPSFQTSTPARSPPRNNHIATLVGRPQINAQEWASPAFLKRSLFFATDYDLFAEEEFLDNDRRKRNKFGRGSGQWRFAQRTPSPEKEPETPPLDIANPSRLPAQASPKGEEVQSLVQQAHGTLSLSKTSSLATSALTDRSELELPSEYGPTAKDTSVQEREEPPTSLGQVNGGRHMTHEVQTPEEREKVDGSIARPTNPTSKIDCVDDEVSQEPAQVVQVSRSAPNKLLSSASPSGPGSDQESDEESDQEPEDISPQESASLFGEQSESGQSNAAIYSDHSSDFGLDGSTFSRPPPLTESGLSSSVLGKFEERLEFDGLNTEHAQNIPSPLQSDVDQIESGAEEPSTFNDSATDLLLFDNEGSGEDIERLEGHDAAQRRSSVQLPYSDHVGNQEAGALDDEAMNDPAAAQLLNDDGNSWKHVDVLQEENTAQRPSSSPPSSSHQLESQVTQEELELRSQLTPDNGAALESITEKGPAGFPGEQSLIPGQEKGHLSEVSDEEDSLETSLEKGPDDSAVQQESPNARQREIVLDERLFREDSKIYTSQGQEIRDRAASVDMLISGVQQTTVEIIDLESDDDDVASIQTFSQEAFQKFVNQNESELAQTIEVSAHDTTPVLTSDAKIELQASISQEYRPSTLPDSTESVLNPVAVVKECPPEDINVEPDIHKKMYEPEKQASRKPSPVARTKEGEDEVPFIEVVSSKQSPKAELESKERRLAENEACFKQSPKAETELKPILIDELPSTVPDSFKDTRSKSQLLTPSSTQRAKFVSQPSSLSLRSELEDDTLPTPRLTQGASAEIVPPVLLAPLEEPTLAETPVPLKKTSALIEKLKEMRRLSNQSPKTRSSDASVLDPWFAPKRLGPIVPDSEDENEIESSPEREAPAKIAKIVGRQLPQAPEKPLARSFIRSPPQLNHISSIRSSPQYLPPSQPPPPGFRTNLSYFVPLATLPSHFATTVDILAIVLSGTPVTRATSGPRDYNQTLHTTDPSSSASQHSITTAQIFRANNRCFPLVEKGDALLLRDFKVQPLQKRLSLLSTESSAWAVFRKGADVQIRGPPVEFGAEERGFARGLWDWWASLGEDARRYLENAVPEYKKPNGTVKITKFKGGGNKSDARIKKEEIEGLGVDLPGSQTQRRESMKERSLGLDDVEEKDMVHESIEAPKRVLRARGANGANGRSESARESRFGTVFTGGLGEPDETQGSAHELRDGKAYRDKRR